MTKEERLLYQKAYRQKNNNICTQKYEKSIKGFLMRSYRNMKSRISGVQKRKFHLYEGKELFPKEDFYLWAEQHPIFLSLWATYVESGFDRKQAPSVDRLDSSKGYSFDNVEWVTHSENSRRGAVQRHQKNPCHS